MEITTLALGDLVNTAISDWIGPVLVGIIAVVALVLLWKRQFAGFLTFAAMAVLAALFVFFGGDLFGKNGNISKAGKSVAKKINAIHLTDTTYAQDFLTR
ncbi:hypothetical protein GCM10017576_23490 [Microbacterium barkeri]|uniref:Uncharacterized protein n=1 Tax=Microbacterium barkeri TaxID=33917 RepID=A0A9W6H4Y3_9MICO|nr:hypothetical protein [Microbacterium barkeri]MDI6944206.1 hypothetical protein [Microbacterium barkeri]MDR6876778.1 hypothetical protein [Microbacterium barkeri]GLJ62219.1 hypothetical protein GCM10017576_23490 [Microbacterium barkeri]